MPYLTVAEYVTRFGVQETWLFTNKDPDAPIPPGSYDEAAVEAQLGDATEEVEGYVSRRYATPLASPPKIVKGWVAAIARLKLAEGTGRVSEAIKDAADRATRQLEQLAASKIDLPIDAGAVAPDPVGSGSPLTSNDRTTADFTQSAMDAFTGPFTGGGYAPCWRQGQ